MIKQKDLINIYKNEMEAKYETPTGEIYCYQKAYSRVGLKHFGGDYEWWAIVGKNDHGTAKRKIVEIHNSEYL